MKKTTVSLEKILSDPDLHARAAERVASALAGPRLAASSIPNARTEASDSGGVASKAAVALGALPAGAAAASPDTAGSNLAAGVASSEVNSEVARVFTSGVLVRLGFASPDDQPDLIGALAARVNSALRGMEEFADNPVVASSLAAFVASAMGARLVASPGFGSMLASHLAEASISSTPAARLHRRDSIDD